MMVNKEIAVIKLDFLVVYIKKGINNGKAKGYCRNY